MQTVLLAQTPNQEFTVTIDAVRWGLSLRTVPGCTSCTITREGAEVLANTRALAGEAVIPYAYLQTGNFLFITLNDDLPYWEQFQVSQFLVYASATELAAIPALTLGELAATVQPSFLITDGGFYITTDTGELLTDD